MMTLEIRGIRILFLGKIVLFASGRKMCDCSTLDNLKYPELHLCSSALNEVSCTYSSFFQIACVILFLVCFSNYKIIFIFSLRMMDKKLEPQCRVGTW